MAPSLFRNINLVKLKLRPQLKIVLHYEERNSCSWFPSFVQALASGRGRLNPLVLMVGATSCITELPNTLHFARAREKGRGATAGDSITFKHLLEVAVAVAAVTQKLDQGALGMSDPCGTLQLVLKPKSVPRINTLLSNFYICAN